MLPRSYIQYTKFVVSTFFIIFILAYKSAICFRYGHRNSPVCFSDHLIIWRGWKKHRERTGTLQRKEIRFADTLQVPGCDYTTTFARTISLFDKFRKETAHLLSKKSSKKPGPKVAVKYSGLHTTPESMKLYLSESVVTMRSS